MAQFSPLNKRRQQGLPSLVEPNALEEPYGREHRMLVEAKIWEIAARTKGRLRNMPQDKAQDLVFRAYEAETTPDQQRESAKEALALSRDCADAWLLLADFAETDDERLERIEQAQKAGRRALGIRPFQEDVGRFWTIVETRPYMRAVLRLALALWDRGRLEDATDHLDDLLRLNPADNQGARYLLVPRLLEMGREPEAERLLNKVNEQTASWTYHRALLEFRRQGDAPEAREILALAMRFHPRIAENLAAETRRPPAPSYIQVGLEPEEVVYCRNSLAAWRSVPGALDWLRSLRRDG